MLRQSPHALDVLDPPTSGVVVPILVVTRILGGLGNGAALDHALTRDAGTSAALWGLIGALLVMIPWSRWRRVALIGLGVVHVGLFAMYGEIFDLQHLLGMFIGFTVSRTWSVGGGDADNRSDLIDAHPADAVASGTDSTPDLAPI